jgi:hypothetical protein
VRLVTVMRPASSSSLIALVIVVDEEMPVWRVIVACVGQQVPSALAYAQIARSTSPAVWESRSSAKNSRGEVSHGRECHRCALRAITALRSPL